MGDSLRQVYQCLLFCHCYFLIKLVGPFYGTPVEDPGILGRERLGLVKCAIFNFISFHLLFIYSILFINLIMMPYLHHFIFLIMIVMIINFFLLFIHFLIKLFLKMLFQGDLVVITIHLLIILLNFV